MSMPDGTPAAVTIAIHVVLDQDGYFGQGQDEAEAVADYESRHNALSEATCVRWLLFRATTPLPRPTVLTAAVPAESPVGLTLAVA